MSDGSNEAVETLRLRLVPSPADDYAAELHACPLGRAQALDGTRGAAAL